MDQNEKELRDKKSLKLFLIISLGISFVLEIAYMIFHHFTREGNGILLVAIMWTPAIVAIVLTMKYYKKINMLGVTIGKAMPILLGFFLPFLFLLVSYLISWAIVGDKTIGFTALAARLGWKPQSNDLPILFILSHVVVGIIPSCAGAFGEELGWRGFMYPIMERVTGRKKAVVLSGLIFAIWQLPIGLYNIETSLWYGIIMFVVYQTILGILLAWLRTVSSSILPPLFVHASCILFGQMVFSSLSTNERIPYLAGETGIITIIFMALTGILGWNLWKKHDVKIQEQ